MPRATSVIAAGSDHGHRRDRSVADTVIVDYAQRSAAKVTVTSVKGETIEIDLREPARLRTDDLLVLEDGNLVEVVAAPEPLIEARSADIAGLARLAWHLGDRHVPVQMLPNRIRVRREAATETLLTSLGAKTMMIDAPFDPEAGAYDPSHDRGHDHDHRHDHGHSHDHR